MSFFPPATRRQRCTVTTRGAGAGSSPKNTGTNGSMPAIVNSVVDIASGTSEAPGKRLWPFALKKSMNERRICCDVMRCGTSARGRAPPFASGVLEVLLQLRQRALLQARDVHLRDVHAFGDVRL